MHPYNIPECKGPRKVGGRWQVACRVACFHGAAARVRCGSPPCAWGNVLVPAVMFDPSGSPPCAWGQRFFRAPSVARFPVHPHVHGDNRDVQPQVIEAAGSPPCAWGQPNPPPRGLRRARFTPMCMGTTHPGRDGAGRMAVHPHVHGDNCAPRSAPGPDHRFTPMCMGTTSHGNRRSGPCAVHPHVHGDNVGVSRTTVAMIGSPPCAWGQRKSPSANSARSGSPPCAWGQRHLRRHGRCGDRFTPMCMGTTYSPTGLKIVRTTVHPHVHGDNVVYGPLK